MSSLDKSPLGPPLVAVDKGVNSDDKSPGEAPPPPAHSEETQPDPLPPPAGTDSAGVESPAGTDSAGVLSYESPSPRDIKPRTNENLSGLPPRKTPVLGFFKKDSKRGPENPDRSAVLPSPRLSDIRPEDFKDVGRALELFRQAAKCGLVPDSEHSRLRWLAAIERARTVPARNPAGVFLFIVKNRLWKYLSDGHFEAANARLKAFLHPPMPRSCPC